LVLLGAVGASQPMFFNHNLCQRCEQQWVVSAHQPDVGFILGSLELTARRGRACEPRKRRLGVTRGLRTDSIDREYGLPNRLRKGLGAVLPIRCSTRFRRF
jgi:hypothetical protein